MAKIFISYSRDSEQIATELNSDLEGLGHDVWIDRELSGGQAWWERILEGIRDCDVFAVVITVPTLDSTACQLEREYAAALDRSILPVLASEEVKINLLPPELSKIQFVRYQGQDHESVLSLGRAVGKLPATPPLPDPLPDPPEVPLSYMGGLAKTIKSSSQLSHSEQSELVVKLQGALDEPHNAEDARSLLRELRDRPDLLNDVAELIDKLLPNKKGPVPHRPMRKIGIATLILVALILAISLAIFWDRHRKLKTANRRVQAIHKAVVDYRKAKGEFPPALRGINRPVPASEIFHDLTNPRNKFLSATKAEMIDPWEKPIKVVVGPAPRGNTIKVVSSGPDGIEGNGDDLTAGGR